MAKLRFREGNKEDRSQESTSSSCHEKGQDVPLNGQYLDHLKLGTQEDLQASVDLGFLGWPPGSPCLPPHPVTRPARPMPHPTCVLDVSEKLAVFLSPALPGFC